MEFELNIYGTGDEIINRYGTNHIRWNTLIEAIQLQERIKDANTAQQFDAISAFVLTIFEGMTAEELGLADAFDVMNLFNQIVAKAKKIKGGGKNA